MSPQTRRGRAASASHRKTAPRGAPTRKPVAGIEELDEEELDEFEPKRVKRKKAPVQRGRLAGLRRSSGYKYLNEAIGAYVPLFIALCVGFAGLWAWISFGPHTNTPKENWIQIEKLWIQPREDARQRVTDAVSDFKAQQDAYKAFRDATNGWMDDMSKISSWDAPNATLDPNAYYTSTEVATQFITAGRDEVTVLDKVIAAKSSEEVLAIGAQVIDADKTFDSAYEIARSQIVGIETTTQPTLALPSGSLGPCATPSASPSVTPAPTLGPGATATPTPRPTPTPTPSASPPFLPTGSPSPSPSVAATPCLPVTPAPGTS